MPTRRWGEDVISDDKHEFENVTGRAYRDAEFKTPETTPPAVRKTVATIKVLEAGQRQIEIMTEARHWPKSGDAFIPPKDKEHLLDEHARHEETISRWKAFQ
jgi:hypothetical protein